MSSKKTKGLPSIALPVLLCLLAGCAWNDDGTSNYSKTYENIFGKSEANAPS